MKKRNSVTARILAALALAAVVVAVISIVSSGLKDDSSKSKDSSANHPAKQHKAKHRTKAKTYEVRTGDTLISISQKTGIPVNAILALNPEVDPQILIAGEVLKLQE